MLSKFSVNKPMTVVVAIILVLILGCISLINTSTDLLPEMELPYVLVMTSYPGASPEEVELQVTQPLEASLAMISGLKNSSSSSAENVSTVILEFQQQADMASVMVELSSMVDSTAAMFPEGVGSPVFIRLNPSMLPIAMLTADMEGKDTAELSAMIEDTVIPAFRRVEGIASVSAIGLITRQAELVWDEDVIEGYNDRILGSINGELAKSKRELDKARNELKSQRKEYDAKAKDLYGDLAETTNKLNEGRIQLEMGKAQLDAQPAQLEAQKEELMNTRSQLIAMLDLYDASDQLAEGVKQLEAGLDQMDDMDDAISAYYGSVPAARRAIQNANSGLSSAYNAYTAALATGDMTAIAGAGANFGAAAATAGEVLANIAAATGAGTGAGGGMPSSTDPAEIYPLLSGALTEADGSLSQLISGKREAEATYNELKTQQTMLDANLTMSKSEVEQHIREIEDGIAQINKALAIDIPDAKKELEKTDKELKDGALELEKGKLEASTQLSSAGVQLAMAESQLDAAYDQFYTARDEAFKSAGLDGALSPAMLGGILGAEHFAMPAGYLPDGDDEILLKVGEKFVSLDELQNLTLMDIDIAGIGAIKVSDVTDMQITDNGDDSYAMVNGNPGLILSIQKQSLSGTSEVCDDMNEVIAQLEEENPGLHLIALYDQGFYINTALSAVTDNLLLGAVLAIIVLLLFLRSIKPTAIIALSIPISLMVALTLMYFSGVTINIVSLAGLAMGVGMLVDNSIVVIENIYRMRSEGTPPKEAAVYGAKQVSGAIAASTLTTVCVFLPILFTHGLTREIFADMGLTVTYSLAASLLVAMTLIPAAASRMLTRPAKETAFFSKMLDFYTEKLRGCLKRKWIVFAVSGGVVVACFAGVAFMGTAFIPEVDYGQLSITLTAEDEDASAEKTQELANRALDKILTLDYIDMAAAYDPADMATMMGTGEGISMYVLLDPEAKVSSEKAAADIAEVTEDIPANIVVSNSGADMSAMMGSGVQILVKGDDMDKLMATAEEIGKLVEGIEGFEDIDNGLGDPAKELRVTVDKNKAMKYGLTVSQIYSMLSADISTSTDSITVTTDDGDYPIVIKADPDKVLTREKLADHKFTVNVPDSSGATKEKTVYLTDIADVTETTGPAAISHTDQTRYIQVSAMAAEGYNLGLLSRDLEDALAEYTAPAGVSVELSGENENIKDMLGDTILMILLACAFIYLIMVAQFQSLLLPFIIIFTIPLAFSGGLLCLMICGQEISIVAMLGFLLLAGIIVNNGIVFIDRVNQLVAEGYQRQEALVTAGRQRMRPILMTALTTICSLLAMVFSRQMGAEMLRPMAIVAAAGMVYATVLTLFLVPALYDIFKGKSEKRKARREAARAAKEQAVIPEKAEI